MNIYKIVRCIGHKYREIVDETDNMETARYLREQYQLADDSATYLIRVPPNAAIKAGKAKEWHKHAAKRDIN